MKKNSETIEKRLENIKKVYNNIEIIGIMGMWNNGE